MILAADQEGKDVVNINILLISSTADKREIIKLQKELEEKLSCRKERRDIWNKGKRDMSHTSIDPTEVSKSCATDELRA